MNYTPKNRFSTDVLAVFDEALAKTAEEMKERLNDEYISKPLRDYIAQYNFVKDTRIGNLGDVKRFGDPIDNGGA